jgi:hypothetical protein
VSDSSLCPPRTTATCKFAPTPCADAPADGGSRNDHQRSLSRRRRGHELLPPHHGAFVLVLMWGSECSRRCCQCVATYAAARLCDCAVTLHLGHSLAWSNGAWRSARRSRPDVVGPGTTVSACSSAAVRNGIQHCWYILTLLCYKRQDIDIRASGHDSSLTCALFANR